MDVKIQNTKNNDGREYHNVKNVEVKQSGLIIVTYHNSAIHQYSLSLNDILIVKR